MRALETVPGADPLSMAPFGLNGDAVTDNAFVRSVKSEVEREEDRQRDTNSLLYQLFPRLPFYENQTEKRSVMDPELGETKEKEKAVAANEKIREEAFSIKALSTNFKILKSQMAPIFVVCGLLKKLRDWEHPLVTVSIILMLLNLAYQDLLSYLPAALCLLNAFVLALFWCAPNAVGATLLSWAEPTDKSKAINAGSAPGAEEATSHVGWMQRIMEYKDAAFKTKDSLQSFQNSLLVASVWLRRVEGLYKWWSPRPSQTLLAASVLAAVLLAFVPFRLIFPFIVLDFFTTRFQREGSFFTRLLEQVAVHEHPHSE